ncbi:MULTISPECIES: NUDIX hydrolase [unclassified Pseudonocardia]|uniref:NUDIX hydrolase n=1 Tax=unclassified Pseudonocardia TaxID=2619320 RepID=UPI00095A7E12|nr:MULTISPECIES: NUDIX hydrolase [unclassified Pseudonocardia]MBN9097709.1 NUDIX hydrolase [Pseudonocardia sp.]OJY40004.1 MAG: hypothetical protein BGP03_22390 [Pseudonocardia sp. 73-21]
MTISALVVGALLLVWLVVVCVTRVRRLDRLHVRMDAARAGLALALERRRSAAAPASGPVVGAAVAAARAVDPGDREAAENALGRALAALDRSTLPEAARHELAEAEQAVALARRVHNDAVRDTLALRSRRLVRWLHLAGTAPMPAYFEIADPAGVTAPAAAPVNRAAPPR